MGGGGGVLSRSSQAPEFGSENVLGVKMVGVGLQSLVWFNQGFILFQF